MDNSIGGEGQKVKKFGPVKVSSVTSARPAGGHIANAHQSRGYNFEVAA